jgi:murein L,D-transpeptidase YafK
MTDEGEPGWSRGIRSWAVVSSENSSNLIDVNHSFVFGVREQVFGKDKVSLAEQILIEKSAHRLTLIRAGKSLRVYRISLGKSPIGRKEREGDGKTPEGQYVIDRKIIHSSFHRALHISYPNAADRTRAAVPGVSPGGDIMIHGLKNGLGWLGPLHRFSDWTQGCIAVTNAEIEETWDMVPEGTLVKIVP